MTRFIVLAAVATLMFLLQATHEAIGGSTGKVKICHVNRSNEPGVVDRTRDRYHWEYFNVWPWGYWGWRYKDTQRWTRTYFFGKVIEVDESALDAHVAHGDATTSFYPLGSALKDYLTSAEDDNGTHWSTEFTYRYRDAYDNVNAVIKNADCFWFTHQNK